jgi:hypothetical protein
MAVLEQLEHRRFTSAEILRMVESGILGEDERLELLEGELNVKSPQNPQHAALAAKLQRLVGGAAPPNSHLRLHSPIAARPQATGGYTESRVAGPGETVSVPGLVQELAVADLLP